MTYFSHEYFNLPAPGGRQRHGKVKLEYDIYGIVILPTFIEYIRVTNEVN